MVLYLAEAAESAGWWSPTAAGAYATFAAVLVSLSLGVASIFREEDRAEKRRQHEQRARDAEVSAHAYALRRQLWEWTAQSWPQDAEGRAKKARELTQAESLDRAEKRSLRIVTAAPQASAEISEPARRQYVLFYRATLILNRAGESPYGKGFVRSPVNPNSPYEQGWGGILGSGMARARELVEECVEVLTQAIDEELLEEEKRLDSVYE